MPLGFQATIRIQPLGGSSSGRTDSVARPTPEYNADMSASMSWTMALVVVEVVHVLCLCMVSTQVCAAGPNTTGLSCYRAVSRTGWLHGCADILTDLLRQGCRPTVSLHLTGGPVRLGGGHGGCKGGWVCTSGRGSFSLLALSLRGAGWADLLGVGVVLSCVSATCPTLPGSPNSGREVTATGGWFGFGCVIMHGGSSSTPRRLIIHFEI